MPAIEAVERGRPTGLALRWLWGAGAAITAGLSFLTLLSGAVNGGRTGPQIALVLACAATVACSIAVGCWRPEVVPALIAAAATIVLITEPSETFNSASASGPFGYSNAKAALFVLGSTSALMLAVSAGRWVRMALIGLAVLFGVVPVVNRSVAASAVVVALPVVALLVRGRMRIAAMGLLLAASVLAALVLGAVYSPESGSEVQKVAAGSLDRARLALWSEALGITRRNPLVGVGPGRFSNVSQTAGADDEIRWAHNEYLQLAAETGVLGGVLLVAGFLWGFAVLLGREGPDSFAALGAASLAALGINACVDYLLHFPALPIAAFALVGAAVGAQSREATYDSSSPSD